MSFVSRPSPLAKEPKMPIFRTLNRLLISLSCSFRVLRGPSLGSRSFVKLLVKIV